MRIVLDAMGSDDCQEPEVQASIEAVRQFSDEIYLVGPQDELNRRLQSATSERLPIQVVDAPETITIKDKGLALALKAKRKGSTR